MFVTSITVFIVSQSYGSLQWFWEMGEMGHRLFQLFLYQILFKLMIHRDQSRSLWLSSWMEEHCRIATVEDRSVKPQMMELVWWWCFTLMCICCLSSSFLEAHSNLRPSESPQGTNQSPIKGTATKLNSPTKRLHSSTWPKHYLLI